MRRLAIALVLFACWFIACRGQANAAAEICPAHVYDWHAYPATADGIVYGMVLDAKSPRSVRGTIVLATNVGYFTFSFPDTKLALDAGNYQTPDTMYEYDRYLSAPLYVRLPADVTDVKRWWVTSAATTGETFFGWDAHGMTACSLEPIDLSPSPHRSITDTPDEYGYKRLNPRPYNLKAAPSASAAIATAASASAPGDLSCATPFAMAVAIKPVTPNVSTFIRARDVNAFPDLTVLVDLTIDSDGSVADSRVLQPSGSADFDAAAVVAAAKSTYKPAISFCQPVPGEYVFRAEQGGDAPLKSH